MTFESFEESEYLGLPTQLYRIELGTTSYYLTSAEEPITIGPNTYQSYEVSDSGIVESGEKAKNEIVLTIAHDHPVSVYLLQNVPTSEILLTIYRLHRTDSPYTVQQQWKGVLVNWDIIYPRMELSFSPYDHEIGREMMHRSFGPDCQWTQYDDGCNLEPSLFSSDLTVSTVSGTSVTFTTSIPTPSPISSPNEHYRGGYLQVTGSHGFERAQILSHGSTSANLDRVLPALIVGATATIIPSCRGDIVRCETYFNNVLRFLGAPHADKINPFTGDGVKKSGDIYT